MPLAQALAKKASCSAKNSTGSSITSGDVVMFQLDGTDDGLDLISPVLLNAQPENLLMGVGAVEAPSGMTIGAAEFCLMKRSGPGKVRVNGSGTAIAIGDLLYPQQGLFLAVTKAAQPDVVGGEGSILSSSAVIGAATTSEVAFDKSLTVPANALAAGDVVIVQVGGTVIDNNGSDELTVRVRIGGEIASASAGVNVADNDAFSATVACTVRTAGASGTFKSSTNGGVGTAVWSHIGGSSLNTTTATAITASAQYNASHADNEVQLDTLSVRVMRPNREQISQQAFAVAQEASTSADAVINAYFLGR